MPPKPLSHLSVFFQKTESLSENRLKSRHLCPNQTNGSPPDTGQHEEVHLLNLRPRRPHPNILRPIPTPNEGYGGSDGRGGSVPWKLGRGGILYADNPAGGGDGDGIDCDGVDDDVVDGVWAGDGGA